MGWPVALRELKDSLFEVYLAAGAPSLDEIAGDVAEDDRLPGAPSRDTVRRVISEPTFPPQQADVVAVATVLARRARRDEGELARQVGELWVRAGMAKGVGRPIGEFDDNLVLADLEVHPALETGDARTRFGVLPRYVPREHDTRLRTVVAAALAGTSGTAVLVGASATGKSRALWEAVRALPGDWRLWHPISPDRPDALLAGLSDVAPRTVVWMNEAQLYLGPEPSGERVARALRELLNDASRAPVLVLATLWPDHWKRLTARAEPDRPNQPDPRIDTRRLLQGHVIDVPDAFTRTDLAALTGAADADPRLTEAAERARDAQVTQYLAGTPFLMERYSRARGAARALIHAAMDARRLGAGPDIPMAWLEAAVPAYLTGTEFDALDDDWLEHALQYAAAGGNGIPGILSPVRTDTRNQRGRRAAATGTPAKRSSPASHYRLADHLEQYGRHHRSDRIPPVDFWTSAAQHADQRDLVVLGNRARDRGLYRDAAQLHKLAAAQGDPKAARSLLGHFQHLDPTDHRPARWVADHLGLADSSAVAWLLDSLWVAGAKEQFAALAERAAAHVALDDPGGLAEMLDSLRVFGAKEQAATLAARAAGHAGLDDPSGVAALLKDLWKLGETEQVARLLARDPAAHAGLDNPSGVAALLNGLSELGETEQVARLLARDPAAHAGLDDPSGVAWLVRTLLDLGADQQAGALAARSPAARAGSDHRSGGSGALERPQEPGTPQQARPPARQVPAPPTGLDDPYALIELLWEVPAKEQIATPAARAADRVVLDDPDAVTELLNTLQWIDAHEQAAALVARLPAAGMIDQFMEFGDNRSRFRFGREPDGSAAPPWTWDDLE
ncbi:hypothetical protein [Kitasatospora sp. NPDC001683]